MMLEPQRYDICFASTWVLMTYVYLLLPSVWILRVSDLERWKIWLLEERSVFRRIERPWVSGSHTWILVTGRCGCREGLFSGPQGTHLFGMSNSVYQLANAV